MEEICFPGETLLLSRPKLVLANGSHTRIAQEFKAFFAAERLVAIYRAISLRLAPSSAEIYTTSRFIGKEVSHCQT